MTQALQTMGHHREKKAADALVRGQGHGLKTIPLAAVAEGKTHLPMVDIDEAVIGDGHTVGVAPEIVEPLPRSCHGTLGIDHPRLVIEAVDAALKAVGRFKGGGLLREPPGLPAVVGGVEELGAKHTAQRLHGKQAPRRCWHPAGALIRQGSAWHQRVPMAMGLECLIPGVQEPETTELAAQVVGAELQQRLAGGTQPQGKKRAFVGEDEGGKVMGEGKDAVEIGHRQEVGLARVEPRCLGKRLAFGAVAMATGVVGIALEAALGAL